MLVALLLSGLGLAPQADEESFALDCGPLQLEVHVSRTAHLFHVVDQISEWSEFTHGQYGRALADSIRDEDREVLARHRGLRRERGWGRGLEQTFYSAEDLTGAAASGVTAGHLTEREAEEASAILAHFGVLVDALIAAERGHLERFAQRLRTEQERLTEAAEQLSKFCSVERVSVPVFLLANPHDRDFGGGYNGGRLTLEVPRAYDAFPTFLHEVLHAFLDLRRPALEEAREGVPRLDYQTFNEGIAHAFAPGIIAPEGEGDPLLERVREGLGRDRSIRNAAVRFHRYALLLRPILRDALGRDQNLEQFLPRAVDAWRALTELQKALQ